MPQANPTHIPSSQSPARVIVVDDEAELTRALCETLSISGYAPTGFTNPKEALERLKEESFEVMLVDLMMPEMDGISLLKSALQKDPYLVGIIMTGQGTVQTAVEAMKNGAFDYILKPFKISSILTSVARAVEFRNLRRENYQLREMINIYELGQVVSSTLDIETVLQKTTEAAQKQLLADEASIMLAEQDHEHLTVAIATGDDRRELVGRRVPVTGSIAGWVLNEQKPLIFHKEVQDPRFTDDYSRPDIQTSISMPMVSGNKALGVLNLNKTRRHHTLTEGQLDGLRVLINIASSAIENARLADEAQRELQIRRQRERELEAIARVSAAMRASRSRAEMVPAILKEIQSLIGSDSVALGILEEQAGQLLVELGQGRYSSYTGARLPADTAEAGVAIRTQEAFFTHPILNDQLTFVIGEGGDLPASAFIPLLAQDMVIGLLWIAVDREISSKEMWLLTSLADIAASSLQRLALYNQTEKHLQQLMALRTIDLAISSSMDLRVVLTIFLDQVVSQLEADTAAVLLRDSHTQSLEFTAGRGFRTNYLESVRSLAGDDFVGAAALEQKTIQITDIDKSHLSGLVEGLSKNEGVRSCFATPLIAKGEVKGVLMVCLRGPYTPDTDWSSFLEALAGQAAIAIDSARLFNDLQHSNQQLALAYNATIEGWSRALDLRDKETEGHTQRVTEMTLRLANRMGGFDEDDLLHIRQGSLLHDIGKMGVPDQILLKPEKLTEEEWEIMRQHPVYAYQLLLPIAYLRLALEIPYSHHERWNGAGYPQGLKGEQIPLAARIFAVVDVWDALRSDRPYRPGWPDEKVLSYLQERSGIDFDPQVVDVFFKLMQESKSA